MHTQRYTSLASQTLSTPQHRSLLVSVHNESNWCCRTERVWLARLEKHILYIQSYFTTTHIQGCEGQAILNRELSECAVIRLSPERIQREDEDQDGGVALLRSRVEQQSTLIAMLKQRGDETLREVSVIQGLTCTR